MEIAKRLVTDYGDPLLVILSCSLVLIALLFVLSWFVTKRRFGGAGHQVPGGVVRDYLDSVIQNSTSLRSSLFREQNVEHSSPSVIPVYKLKQEKEQQQQKSEIEALKSQLSQRQKDIGELEKKVQEAKDQAHQIQELGSEMAQLKEQLEQAQRVQRERDELREQLQQYQSGQAVEAVEHKQGEQQQQEEERLEEQVQEQDEESVADDMLAVDHSEYQQNDESDENDEDDEEGEGGGSSEVMVKYREKRAERRQSEQALTQQKSPEDLLDEFEKMLG